MSLLNYADVPGAFTNLIALESQITSEVGQLLNQALNSEARPFMRYDSGVYPKWLNSLSNAKPEPLGSDEEYDPYTVDIELQLGKRTEGQDGALEETLQVWVPYTLASFQATPRLQSAANPNVPKFLLGAGLRLETTRMPGDIIAAQFVLTLAFSVQNRGRF